MHPRVCLRCVRRPWRRRCFRPLPSHPDFLYVVHLWVNNDTPDTHLRRMPRVRYKRVLLRVVRQAMARYATTERETFRQGRLSLLPAGVYCAGAQTEKLERSLKVSGITGGAIYRIKNLRPLSPIRFLIRKSYRMMGVAALCRRKRGGERMTAIAGVRLTELARELKMTMPSWSRL